MRSRMTVSIAMALALGFLANLAPIHTTSTGLGIAYNSAVAQEAKKPADQAADPATKPKKEKKEKKADKPKKEKKEKKEKPATN